MSNFLDVTGLSYFWSKIKEKFVLKESGKGLSTNDFTNEEKQKLQNISENANNYTLPSATSDTLGGVKVGQNMVIDGGRMSAKAGRLFKATFLVDGWVEAEGLYSQTVQLIKINGSPDVQSSDFLYPVIGIDNNLDDSIKEELRPAALIINKAKKTLGYNQITVEVTEKPTVDTEVYFEIENSLQTVYQNFEFPFSNESLTDPAIEFGTVEVETEDDF